MLTSTINARGWRYAPKNRARLELPAIKVIWINEPWTGSEIESDSSFKTKHVSDFVSVQFLGYRTLTQKEAIATLHRFGNTFPYVDRDHGADRFRMHLHRWITIAGDVLDAGAQTVGVLCADHGSVIAYAQKNPAADGVGKGHKFPRERRQESLLEFKGRPFSLLNEDFKVVKGHVGTTDLTAPDFCRISKFQTRCRARRRRNRWARAQIQTVPHTAVPISGTSTDTPSVMCQYSLTGQ